jgi:hypothetical protein
MKYKVINIDLTKSIVIVVFIMLLSSTIYLILGVSTDYKKFSFGSYDVCCKRIRKTNDKITIDKCTDGTIYHNISTLVIEKEIKNVDECSSLEVIKP